LINTADGNFKGVCRTLPTGEFRSYSWMFPMSTDSPSSIKVGKKVMATLFEHDDYRGDQLQVYGDRANACGSLSEQTKGQLSNFNASGCGWSEKVSSLKVTKM
jgi:hypothetical protein